MCGIAGFSGTGGSAMLSRMADAIAHRGPDDAGEWISADGDVGLAHRRLAIIDLSELGHQPMTDASGRTVIVFNGEIYNFRELRASLRAEGHAFRGESDTEVLLALYRARGEAMLPLINGIFAFAIYDLNERALLLACDLMAVKPLYFYQGSDGFTFASELKGLLAGGQVRSSLDIKALARYLGFLWSPGGATPRAGVGRLGPAEAVRVKEGRVVNRWQWATPAWREVPMSSAEAVGKVGEALRTAVHRQMVADVPVGAFLSGGLDSSAVVAMAREVSPGIECFTIDTGRMRETGATDDLPYARQVARHLGVALREVEVDASSMARNIERMIFQLDEPQADPAALHVLYISELARQNGVKVLLSGTGGDDLFAGYRRHHALMREPYWTWMPRSARRLLRWASAQAGRHGARRVAKAFSRADASADERLIGYFLWTDTARVLDLFAPDHRAALSADDLSAPLESHLATLAAGLPPLQRMLSLEQRFFLADHNLLYTDKMSMAAGVEVRVPFLDADLVHLANSLPSRLKQRGAAGKWVLKKAMESHLPAEILHRPKSGFGVPLRRWLRHELKEWVGDMLSPDTLRRRGLFDAKAVAALIEEDRAGRIDAAYTILSLVCIEVWCQRFQDEPYPALPVAGAATGPGLPAADLPNRPPLPVEATRAEQR
jgi:asparagine synthase (glutamine-hydrolysing)